ncbi:MAG: hypothetical protein A3I44_00475 [Candidatus Sungbacteria bacterium RIFCSPLOWO2_02_FULL_51_17]|uniref:Thymidylate synthase n=1 Tax=Candidatus Sungbacteria bacterium RIFCSPHIGHO2_02_FULL_51_29 TaxID=1802273 RepID=A0A1G2KSV5_9BACT|nr:MAG: hypothetical protein A3C16_00590 [Candidatus Sungbacteria bacterium RIFCSPHIGHO2_02_FULL_51_29]OHA07768.1 MAG: hypothetical protein A3B29_00575 [Candidatus Sungbacteria bacterium RIFCSPLOWO2_01_FULL_51_34]OHA12568.1 MAG: hypothetical protein A3I44_00475 [Candidatus Sungbacteria bacterium RIFCSPLOWO2_02_FULL_51_17]
MTNEFTKEQCEPVFEAEQFSAEDRAALSPFFTNLDRSVYAPLIAAPELIGALCSRASRASKDLRAVYLNEFLMPFLRPVRGPKDTDADMAERMRYGDMLTRYIEFTKRVPAAALFAHPKARAFYDTWLAQYGDDSIAQMAGTHLVFAGISQVAVKHLEDQRIGLAPIERSTRYVDFGNKVKGRYPYYTDPTLSVLGFTKEYEAVMDGLFETYNRLLPRLEVFFAKKFPDEKPGVIKAKAFDTLRGLLPTSALTQVAFFGNGQAFEYMISRSARHPVSEIRWVATRAYEELVQVIPAFLRRLEKPVTKTYQEYLASRGSRMGKLALALSNPIRVREGEGSSVKMLWHDPDGENKILTAMLYDAAGSHGSWEEVGARVMGMPPEQKKALFAKYLEGRTERWQRVGRAFEHAYARFEILMNIGAWRDIHRHRMLTQQRQLFSCLHGHDVPPEVREAGMEKEFSDAVERVSAVWAKIAVHDRYAAQYAVTLSHRVRFVQFENMRQSFWQIELRTIPEGHPDYRKIEQEKFWLLAEVYPMITEHMRVNLSEYDFARRGQEERIQQKTQERAGGAQ